MDLIDTSINLAVIKSRAGKPAGIRLMARSASSRRLENLLARVQSKAEEYGAGFRRENGYPGWEPKRSNLLLELLKRVFKEEFKHKLIISATHGGLECGVIKGKYPDLIMASIGPTIKNAHSVRERVDLQTVDQFYFFLKRVLEEIAELNQENTS